MSDLIKVKTISQVHNYFGLEKPKHPLVTLYSHDKLNFYPEHNNKRVAIDLYQVTIKECGEGNMGYGRNTYDFHESTMLFIKPGQVITVGNWSEEEAVGGLTLMFHPDIIRKSPLGKHIEDYSYFSYDVNEALHLSDEERKSIIELMYKIEKEYSLNIDKHSQKLIISTIELLLDYCNRYYDRQFYTRTNLNKDIVTKFEQLLSAYYKSEKHLEVGLPSVSYCGAELNMSPNYLSDMLKKETGRNAQEHIHFYVIDLAKTQLLSSSESISQIAYSLGFEYPQHFSKLFKSKTGMSPAEYRNVN